MPEHHEHDHDHGSELSEMQLRVRALETILTEKKYVDPAALDEIVQTFETKIGPRIGAEIVARAWSDAVFRQNTPEIHNMVVCTLCSCYPWEVLGLPPTWYKSAPYRSRAVRDPKSVLADFGITLAPQTAIRVWDSTAETRFIVLPMRPADTDGMSEAELAALVTRNSMIGTGVALRPDEVEQ
jgi:nitrile hydratase